MDPELVIAPAGSILGPFKFGFMVLWTITNDEFEEEKEFGFSVERELLAGYNLELRYESLWLL